MVKLIASDIDGTLLMEGTSQLNPVYYEEIKRLRKKGILFAVASGRQFVSVRTLFGPVIEDLYFISDNGAHLLKGKETIGLKTMDTDTVRDIVHYVRTLPDHFMLFSTPDGAYSDCKNEEMIRKNESGYGVQMNRVEDVLKLDLPVIKIAVLQEHMDAVDMAAPAQVLFGERASVTASGAHWVDFMAKDTDKGSALTELQEILGISKNETIAFGDNINDITLFEGSGTSYAVATAREEAKKAATHVLPEEEDAVLQLLRTL